jgi:hypothetical protein
MDTWTICIEMLMGRVRDQPNPMPLDTSQSELTLEDKVLQALSQGCVTTPQIKAVIGGTYSRQTIVNALEVLALKGRIFRAGQSNRTTWNLK